MTLADAAKDRSYHALHDLNTRPAISYLAKVRRNSDGSDGVEG